MAKRKDKLSFVLYIGDKRVDTLPEEYRKKLAERLSETMSRYYAQHPEEYILLPDEI